MAETLTRPKTSSAAPERDPLKPDANKLDLNLPKVGFEYTPGEPQPKVDEGATAKAELAALPDAEVRQHDVDALNRNQKFRAARYNMTTNQVRRAGDYIMANLRNIRDSPKLYARGIKLAFHEMRHDRYKAKMGGLDAVPAEWSEHQRSKYARLEKSYTDAKQDYDNLNDRMEGRLDSVGEKATERYEARKQELLDKKAQAMARKIARTELRERGVGRLASREIAKNIPPEQLRRVASLAITAEAYRRKGNQEARAERKSVRAEAKLANQHEENRRAINNYKYEAGKSEARAEQIELTDLPEAEKSLEELEGKLKDLDENDPTYHAVFPGLQGQADAARDKIAALKAEQARETQSAERARARVKSLESEQTTLAEQIKAAEQATAETTATRTGHGDSHKEYTQKSKDAFGELLDSKKAAEASPEPAAASTPKPITPPTPPADLKPFPVPNEQSAGTPDLPEVDPEYVAAGTQALENYVNNPTNGTGKEPTNNNEAAPATSPEQQEPSESAYSDKQNQLISIYEESRLAKQESETLYNDLKESKMLLAEAVMRDAPANVINMLKREADAKNDAYEVAKEKLGEIYKRQADLVDELDAEGQLDAVNALYDENGDPIDTKENKQQG